MGTCCDQQMQAMTSWNSRYGCSYVNVLWNGKKNKHLVPPCLYMQSQMIQLIVSRQCLSEWKNVHDYNKSYEMENFNLNKNDIVVKSLHSSIQSDWHGQRWSQLTIFLMQVLISKTYLIWYLVIETLIWLLFTPSVSNCMSFYREKKLFQIICPFTISMQH